MKDRTAIEDMAATAKTAAGWDDGTRRPLDTTPDPDQQRVDRAYAEGVEAGLLWALGHAGAPSPADPRSTLTYRRPLVLPVIDQRGVTVSNLQEWPPNTVQEIVLAYVRSDPTRTRAYLHDPAIHLNVKVAIQVLTRVADACLARGDDPAAVRELVQAVAAAGARGPESGQYITGPGQTLIEVPEHLLPLAAAGAIDGVSLADLPAGRLTHPPRSG